MMTEDKVYLCEENKKLCLLKNSKEIVSFP